MSRTLILRHTMIPASKNWSIPYNIQYKLAASQHQQTHDFQALPWSHSRLWQCYFGWFLLRRRRGGGGTVDGAIYLFLFTLFSHVLSQRVWETASENRSFDVSKAINQMMKATSHSAALDMWWIVVDELNHRTKRGKAKEITHSLTHSSWGTRWYPLRRIFPSPTVQTCCFSTSTNTWLSSFAVIA